MDTVRVDSRNEVTVLSLRRPEVRNALNEVLIAELGQALSELPSSGRVVVLQGEGPAFCAGADVAWLKRSRTFTREENEKDAASLAGLLRALDECPWPVIARVQGAALGGGAGLVAACDIAVVEEGTQFGFPEVRLGLVPAVISPFVLSRIGARSARRYFLTGERFGASEALAMGLAHEVAPKGTLDARVEALLRDLLQGGPLALKAAKQLIRDQTGLPRDRALEHGIRTMAGIRITPEAQEGLSAFLEKRKPRWP